MGMLASSAGGGAFNDRRSISARACGAETYQPRIANMRCICYPLHSACMSNGNRQFLSSFELKISQPAVFCRAVLVAAIRITPACLSLAVDIRLDLAEEFTDQAEESADMPGSRNTLPSCRFAMSLACTTALTIDRCNAVAVGWASADDACLLSGWWAEAHPTIMVPLGAGGDVDRHGVHDC